MQAQQRKSDIGDRRSAIADLARRCFHAYETADRSEIESLLTDDFTFTSPYDDHIDRATYFERCWPGAGTLERFDLQQIAVDGESCLVVYTGKRKQGGKFHNTEHWQLAGDRIKAVEVFFGLVPGSEPEPSPEDAKQGIRRLLDAREQAFRNRDAAAIARLYTEDAISFGLAPPLRLDAVTTHDSKRLDEWFATWKGPPQTELRELHIEAHGNIGFATALQRLVATSIDDKRTDMWMRATYCFRHEEGAWKIASSHESVPFAMDGSFRALTDLTS